MLPKSKQYELKMDRVSALKPHVLYIVNSNGSTSHAPDKLFTLGQA